ncbi:MAG: TonB-dependent receptor domain-containing protein, partial [Candidatus Latescibacterota bacterium]
IKFYNATSSHYETVGKDFTLQTNAKYRLRERLNLKFGMKARSQNATIDRASLAWTYGKDAYLTDFPRDAFPVRGGFLTEISSPYNNVLQDFLTVDAATSVMNRTEFEPKLSVSDGSNSSVATAIVDVTEQHYEGYLMGTLETSPDFRVIPGVRLAYTHATGKSNAWLSKERKAIPTEGSDGYLSVLPMVSAIYSPEDRYTIRAAGSRTFFMTLRPLKQLTWMRPPLAEATQAFGQRIRGMPTFWYRSTLLG